jgi:PAS domain S-box-containing protein
MQSSETPNELEPSRLREVLDVAGVSVRSHDVALDMVSWDGRLPRMLGYTDGVPRTFETWLARIHPDDRERVLAHERAVLAPAAGAGRARHAPLADIEYRVFHRDGSIRWLHERCTVLRRDDGTPYRVLGTVVDVTERVRAEEARWESETRFRVMADAAPILIWMSARDARVEWFNQQWLQFTGRTLLEELGDGWQASVHPDDLSEFVARYREAFDARRPFILEYRLRRHDGQYRWLRDTGVPRHAPDGSFLGYVGSCVDVTDQRHAEADVAQLRRELARAMRIVLLGELTASLSHELSQPLTAVASNAEAARRFLAAEPPNLAEVDGALADLIADARRASDIMRHLRSLAARGEDERIPLDLNAVVAEVLAMLHGELAINRVDLTFAAAADLPPVTGDRVQLQQVLMNFVRNAIEAVAGELPATRRAAVRTSRTANGDALVEVEDSGPGLDPDAADRLFEPFFTTKRHGIGLGLSISRSIVEAHGGHVSARRNPARGMTFCFVLPAGASVGD